MSIIRHKSFFVLLTLLHAQDKTYDCIIADKLLKNQRILPALIEIATNLLYSNLDLSNAASKIVKKNKKFLLLLCTDKKISAKKVAAVKKHKKIVRAILTIFEDELMDLFAENV